MCKAVLVAAAVALGIDAGWQPLPEGGLEYIIQIEPPMLESLKAGEVIGSDIPPMLKDIRSYRIIVGTGDLPRELGPEPAPKPEPPGPSEPLESAGDPSVFPRAEVPRELTPPPDTRPLPEQLAVFNEEPDARASRVPAEKDDAESSEPRSSKPWLPLTLALAGLFGSVGGMLYLGWVAWDYRRRYGALLRQMIEAGQPTAAGGRHV